MSDSLHNYQYDAEGNLLKVDGGTTASYAYSPLNRRVETKTNGGATVREIAYNIKGQRSAIWDGIAGTMIQAQTYWGATPVAFYSNGSIHYQHQDWLGTERARTGYNGAVEGTYNSLPFGDNLSVSGADNDPSHFAQLDHDSESSTEHAQFRQHSSTQGRWMSPDPYDGSYQSGNPQSLNRYSYVMNSPLSFTDQSGLDCSVVVGGITQSPNTPGTAAEHNFASRIGGIEAYPYAGGSTIGGVLNVGLQTFSNTSASYVAAAAFTTAAQSGKFNIFTFSGGLQATINALDNLVSPQVRGLVNNITVLSPGSGLIAGVLPSGTGATTVLDGNSAVDLAAAGGFNYGAGSTGCGHSANCAFTKNKARLLRLAGGKSGCKTQAVFTPRGSGGGGGTQIDSTNWSYAFLFLYYPGGGDDGATVTSTQVDTILIP
jgi:RHS repeat-associated protein